MTGLVMARHTTMPPRQQATPYGAILLTSKWQRDRYYLVANGSIEAVSWLFPNNERRLESNGKKYRVVFPPAPTPVTVERELRKVAAAWQAVWNERLDDFMSGVDDGGGCLGNGTPTLSTLGELFDHLHAERAQQVAASTTSRDKARLKYWRDELGNDHSLSELTPERISLGLKRIASKTSPGTANSALGVLKTYLNWANNMGHVADGKHRTVRKLREPPSTKPRKEWWTACEVDLALECARLDRHQPTAELLVAIGCFLGTRVEEAVMLRWQDLELDLVDPRTGTRKPVCHITPHDGWQPKDGEARDVPISITLLEILERHRRDAGYLLEREPNKLGRKRDGQGWVYRYDPKKVWARIIKRVEEAGGKRITMYGMRHSFASNLLIAGVSDVKVSRWLGHADTRMVHRHYGHLLSYDDDINAITRGHSNLRLVEGSQADQKAGARGPLFPGTAV